MTEATYGELLKKFKGNPTHERFVKDMAAIGASVRVYSARGDYGLEIPAVTTDDEHSEQDIIRATKINLRRDAMGRRVVLYP